MDQPTEDRIKKIEERLEKLERQTEPINIIRREILVLLQQKPS